ncbi:MAG: transposase [Bacteroidota bacterium]
MKTFSNWHEYILNYFDGKWSNGIVEGINNKIKMMKRRAFGYRDFQAFRTRVLIEFL